jgi:dipeptidase D
VEEKPEMMLDAASVQKLLFFLSQMPNGVQNYSMDIDGLVETSLNAGIMNLSEEVFQLVFSIRSSVSSRKYQLKERLQYLTEFLGGTLETNGDYPAWEFRKESVLRDQIFSVYENLFGVQPKLEAVHAGLECGIFYSKIPNLDCVSFGPTNYDIHTPQERLNIASVEHYWKLLCAFLEQAK